MQKMNEIRRLPNSLSVQYSELLQNCVHPISDGSNLSFKSKNIRGKKYHYLYISIGSTRREHYLGEETTALLDRIDDEKEKWNSNTDDRELRTRLVGMLIGGGMMPIGKDEGKVISLLERNGVFLAGAALVGTMAFRAYANMLGVTWPESAGTQDIDIAADNHYALALPRTKINLGQLILDSGMGFFEVPALSRGQPSTSFKIRNRELIVDVLAPMRGRESKRPVHLKEFGTHASPLRHLDYLLDEIQPVVLLYEHGIMVNVPAPGRFALHKCAISQKRPAAFAAKSAKDRSQAEQVLAALLRDRPADVSLAYEAATAQGEAFLKSIDSGLDLIDAEVANSVRELIADSDT